MLVVCIVGLVQWMGSAGCVVHVDVHGERVMLWEAIICTKTPEQRTLWGRALCLS